MRAFISRLTIRKGNMTVRTVSLPVQPDTCTLAARAPRCSLGLCTQARRHVYPAHRRYRRGASTPEAVQPSWMHNWLKLNYDEGPFYQMQRMLAIRKSSSRCWRPVRLSLLHHPSRIGCHARSTACARREATLRRHMAPGSRQDLPAVPADAKP